MRYLAILWAILMMIACGPGEAGSNGDPNTPVQVDEECFDFLEDDRANFDSDDGSGYWSSWNTIANMGPWDPNCVVDGVGYESSRCTQLGAGVDQTEYHNICREYLLPPPDGLENTTPCKWKVAAELQDDSCRYFIVCLVEEDWSLVASYDRDFPDEWDEAIEEYCHD